MAHILLLQLRLILVFGLLAAISIAPLAARTRNDSARVSILGNDATQPWKFPQAVCHGNPLVSERHCTVGIVARDEDDYLVKVVSSSWRPD